MVLTREEDDGEKRHTPETERHFRGQRFGPRLTRAPPRLPIASIAKSARRYRVRLRLRRVVAASKCSRCGSSSPRCPAARAHCKRPRGRMTGSFRAPANLVELLQRARSKDRRGDARLILHPQQRELRRRHPMQPWRVRSSCYRRRCRLRSRDPHRCRHAARRRESAGTLPASA